MRKNIEEIYVRLHSRVEPQQREYIKEVAYEKNIPEAELIRIIIREYMEKHG